MKTDTPIEGIRDLMPWAYRQPKPRTRGINYVRAPYIPGQGFSDLVDCYAEHIDWIKFAGQQLTFANPKLVKDAIQACYNSDIKICVGNPPIDVSASGGKDTYKSVVDKLSVSGIDLFEISCIARTIDDEDLCEMISYAKECGIDVIVEIGIAFAHMTPSDDELFLGRRINQVKTAIEAGASIILIESEGLTENRSGLPNRWNIVDSIASVCPINQIAFEADDQDVMSKYIEIYGPKVNMFFNFTKIAQVEAARRGFGPSAFLWGKVVSF